MSDSSGKTLADAGLRRVGHAQALDGVLGEDLSVSPIVHYTTPAEREALQAGKGISWSADTAAERAHVAHDLKTELYEFLRPFFGKQIRIMIAETGPVPKADA